MSISNSVTAPAAETFDDEFNSLNLWNGTSGTWSTEFIYADPNGNGSSLPSNGEQEWYINNNYAPTASVVPWTVNNGILTITATVTNPAIAQYLGYNQPGLPGMGSYQYTSGLLETSHSFAQTYGYFEMRAELPAGQGLWPAFWLLPANGSWPPELDVMEVLGNATSTLYTSIHSNETGVETSAGVGTPVANTAGGYHTYAVDWEADYVTYYFDGQQVYQVPTPSDMHQPMYMLMNLAVGGNWPGDASSTTPLPAQMDVDYVRAYASMPDAAQLADDPSGSTSAVATPPPQDLSYPENFVQTLYETVLQRPTSSGELSYWANEISTSAMSTAQVVAAVVASPEAQTVVQPIVQLYQVFLDRTPDTAGLDFWVNALRNGQSLGDIASQFAASTEFQHHYSTDLGPAAFLNLLYENVLGRAPDSVGDQFWLGQLGAAPTSSAEAAVALDFLGSAQFQTEAKAPIDSWLTAAGSSGTFGSSIAYFSTADVTGSAGHTMAVSAATDIGILGIDLSVLAGGNEITAFNGADSLPVAAGYQNVDLSALTGSFGASVTASPDGSTIIGSHFADTIDLSASASGIDTIGLSGNVYTGLNAAAPGGGTFAYTAVANFDAAGRTDQLALTAPYAATLTGGVAGSSTLATGTIDTTTGHNVFFVAPGGTAATLTDPASAIAAIGAVKTGGDDTFVVVLDNGPTAATSTQFGVYEVTAHETTAATLGTSSADTVKLLGLFNAPGGFEPANYHTPISS